MGIIKELKSDFCLKFHYPEEIQALLKKIAEILDKESMVLAVALGSLSRGELSYRIKSKRLELFSDIDLLAVTKGTISTEEQVVLKKRLKDLKKEFYPTTPLFDIGIEFFSLQDIQRLPLKVRFYELRESGEVLFGPDIRGIIPEFDINKLDRQDTNNIILRRLFSILLYFPKELLDSKKIDLTEDVFKYSLARNALDIATVLLFQKGIFLCTYKKRVEYIVKEPGNFINDFDQDMPDFLVRCLRVKLGMDFSQSSITLFADALKYFRMLLVYTLRNNGVNLGTARSPSALIKKSRIDIFGESGITGVKFNFILKSPNVNLLQKRLRALSYSFLGGITFFLLSMNEAAYLFLKADRQCLNVLDDAWWALMRLGILSGRESFPLDFGNKFLILRKKFFLDFYTKFMIPEDTEQIREVLNWRYE